MINSHLSLSTIFSERKLGYYSPRRKCKKYLEEELAVVFVNVVM